MIGIAKPADDHAEGTEMQDRDFRRSGSLQNLVPLQGGRFSMGSPPTQAGRGDDEAQHTVSVGNFSVADREVSVGEFREFVTKTGYLTDCERNGDCWVVVAKGKWSSKPDASWDHAYRDQQESDPVALVSWFDAVNFANWRSLRDGVAPAYTIATTGGERVVTWNRQASGYRLPTEAEWEYAARAGAIAGLGAADARMSVVKKAGGVTLDGTTSTNMAVWALEWCWDWYAAYEIVTQTDPAGPETGTSRVCRGIPANGSDKCVPPTGRGQLDPQTGSSVLGFRLVRSGH